MNLTEKYLFKLFRAYYTTRKADFPPISDFPHREFAFLAWNHPGMIRHIGYPSEDYLIKHLITHAPRHSYHSATYYENPSADKMERKGYLGCDFVVDIDADHIPTSCRNRHNYAICKSCGQVYQGEKPEKCEKCQATKFDKIIWICDECLNVSRNQVRNLIDGFLLREFHLSMEDIGLNFSGHRGYHVHLEGEAFRNLDQDARREIADYLTGQGFSFKIWNFGKIQNIMQGFTVDQPGWAGKIAREFYLILNQGSSKIEETFLSPIYEKPLTRPLVNVLTDARQYLMTQLKNRSPIWAVAHIGDTSWERIFTIVKDTIKADIDVVVSIDPHRLIRLNGSMHGKSGFKVMDVDYEHIKHFDPLRDALSFPTTSQNTLTVEIKAPLTPPFRIGDDSFGSYSFQERVELPLNAALFLLCKDVAELIKIN